MKDDMAFRSVTLFSRQYIDKVQKTASVSSSWYMRGYTFSYANKKSTAASAPILEN